ncbi:MAG: glucose-6-phosphate isomerase family protein [Candidatus Pacebacteria bacterium]|nr:glucose-6-phosphate isomerase family protein [Candidatus Paceibacterota bacterium]
MEEIDLTKLTPDVRKLKDMKDVLYDKEGILETDTEDLYYMYRGVKEDGELRYDITVIPPLMLGKEYVKTKGHFHASGHSELYTVLEGEAVYLMQKKDSTDSYYVKAKKGESVIVPGEYGHITINATDKALKMANWISKNCISEYDNISKMHGACWFYTTDGWIENRNYKQVPELRVEESLKEIPDNLDFLK